MVDTYNKMMREMMEVQSQLIFPTRYNSNFIVGEKMERLKIKINFECTHADKKETEMELEKIIHYHIYEKIWNIDPKGVKLDVKEIAPKGYCRSCKQRMKMDEISRRNEDYCIHCL